LWFAGCDKVSDVSRSDSAEYSFGFKGLKGTDLSEWALGMLGGLMSSKLKVAGSNPAGVAIKIRHFSRFRSAKSSPKIAEG
jgi:hypothetical protein